MTPKLTTFWQGFFKLVSILSIIFRVVAKEKEPPAGPEVVKTNSSIPLLAGINLAGFEFGIQTDGSFTGTPVPPPTTQIDHFIKQNVNLMRVPVAWDSLQSEMNGKLNETSLKSYVEFIEKITKQGAHAIVDVHSFARYKRQIVGESSSTPAAAMVSLWTQLAAAFKDNDLVIFGLANEPHDLQITTWATTVQQVVTALRKAGHHNMILIPGTEYTSMKAFPQWYTAMKTVKNPDGSFDNLVFEVHRYLDGDNSGKSKECVESHADEVAKTVELLKADKRQVILGETGGGSTETCEKFLPELIKAVTEAYPTFLGFAIWAAGSFDEKYELVTTVKDEKSPTGWKDTPIWKSITKFLPTEAPSSQPKAGGAGGSKPKNKHEGNGSKEACNSRRRRSKF